MNNLTIIVPFWNGHASLARLLDSVPSDHQVIVVNDYGSSPPAVDRWKNVRLVNLKRRGYFSGGCNAGFATSGSNDVLILNQDGHLLSGWEQVLALRGEFGIIGDGVMGHPAWPMGYVQGTFMFIRRDVLNRVGDFNAQLYPLWGATCEFQLRACRAGFKALPLDADPYFFHERGGGQYGKAIQRTLNEQPHRRRLFIKTPPEVSVVITTYNYGRYLRQAVNSVLVQSLKSTEIIIVDDGSTDDTERIGRSLANDWQGIHYMRQRNQGASAAANAGISNARGRYITVLDGDDWMQPERLLRMHTLAEKNPHRVVYDDTTFAYTGRTEGKRLPEYNFITLLTANMMHKGILYPKAAWEQVRGYSLEMDDGREDWEFNIRLGLAGWCGVHLRQPLYMYRRQQQGRTENNGKSRNYFLEKIARLHPDIYERGELPMTCCGGRRKVPTTLTVRRTPAAVTADTLDSPPDATWVSLEYTGDSVGNQIIYGPTKQRYKYGRNQRNLRFWAHPNDVAFLLDTGLFKRITLVKAVPIAAPEKEVIAAPEKEHSETAEPAPVQATSYAQRLADEQGISLAVVPHAGDKVTLGDVKTYLDELGIDY